MSYFQALPKTAALISDPVDHVLAVFTEFDLFRKVVTKREIKSRNEILKALEECSVRLQPNLLQLPANVENDLKQFTLTIDTMGTMIARKDGVYKLVDLIHDLNDQSKGKLQFIEQRVKNNVRMFREGTGLPPVTDADRTKMQKHYDSASKLPERLATPFAVIDYSLVPVFEDFKLMEDKALKAVGFNYDHIAESFVVLKNQKLLAADIPKLTEMFGDGKGKKKFDLLSVVTDVVESINKNSAVKYEIMSPSFIRNPKNANIALVWLIPADKLRALGRIGRSVRLKSWSLPHRHSATL